MNELISCVICNQPGLLRLDGRVVEHPPGPDEPSAFCRLPPLDIVHELPKKSKVNPFPYPYGRAACTCDTRRLEERAS